MLIQMFRPLTEVSHTFQSNKIGDITTASDFSYEPNFYTYGQFTIRIPFGVRFANLIEESTLLYVDHKYWLIVRDVVITINDSSREYEITGTDLKGITTDRITLYPSSTLPGAQGYDVASGSTESIMRHYVDFNMINPADVNRKIIGLVNAEDLNRGIPADTYMSRFEKVSDVLTKIGTNAHLGFDISVDLTNNRLMFDVLPTIDKSERQSERNRIVFDIARGNVKGIVVEKRSSTGKNAFYATKSGGSLETDAVTQLVHDGFLPKGIFRREMQLNVSCESVDDIEIYARKDIGNYSNVLSFEQAVLAAGFGSVFSLGDIVTLKNQELGLVQHVQIIGAKITADDLSLVFNQHSPKLLDLFNQKIKNKGV